MRLTTQANLNLKVNNMDPNMMAQQGAPQPAAPQAPAPEMAPEAPSQEEQLQQAVMKIADEIMAEWKKTGKIDGKKVSDEKEAKRTAVAMALRVVEEQAAMQQKEAAAQQAPAQAPQAPMGGGGMPPQGGGMM